MGGGRGRAESSIPPQRNQTRPCSSPCTCPRTGTASGRTRSRNRSRLFSNDPAHRLQTRRMPRPCLGLRYCRDRSLTERAELGPIAPVTLRRSVPFPVPVCRSRCATGLLRQARSCGSKHDGSRRTTGTVHALPSLHALPWSNSPGGTRRSHHEGVTGMGFFTGRVTFLRFAVGGPAPRQFDDEHLDRLREHAAGRQAVAAADGVEAGWAAGRSVLDLDFDLAKNVINDTLHFDLRVDTDRLPGDLLKAYYEADLTALARDNPSGFASAKQKREAKESAQDRLAAEAQGRAVQAAEVHPGAVGPGDQRGAVRGRVRRAGGPLLGPVRPHVRAPPGVAHRRPAGRAHRRQPPVGRPHRRRVGVRAGCRGRGRVGAGRRGPTSWATSTCCGCGS